MNSWFTPTDLNVVWETAPATTGSAETDIYYGIAGVAFGAPGIAWCDDAIDSLRCDQHYVNFSDNGAVTPVRACHETGHAVGLLHGSDATPAVDDLTPELFCMQAPTAAIASNTGLGAHNTAHVNVVY